MNVYEQFINEMEQKNLNKGAVIDVLNLYVNGSKFIQHLDEFDKREGERYEYHGVIYSEEYEKDDEGYFGENRILFYSSDDEDAYDIVTYDEMYEYLRLACEFYVERHECDKDIVNEKLISIRKNWCHA